MKRTGQAAPQPAGFFVLRSPAVPVDTFLDLGADLQCTGAQAPSAEAIERDAAVVRTRLGDLLERPEIREAMLTASPSLFVSYSHWRDRPGSPSGQKFERTAFKYVTRMATRSTPFGLFAGIAVGRIGQSTHLRLGPLDRAQRNTRIDSRYLHAIIASIERRHSVRDELRFTANSSVYRAGRLMRYVERKREAGDERCEVSSVESDEFIDAVLASASTGVSLASLGQGLRDLDDELTAEEVDEYLHELVDSDILVSDLWPPLTGGAPLAVLRARLAGIDSAREASSSLEQLDNELATIDREGIGAGTDRHRSIDERLRQLAPRISGAAPLHVDLHHHAPGLSISPVLADELCRAVDTAYRVALPRSDRLASFRRAFTDRYGDRRVPLALALDPELGVGYLSPPPLPPLLADTPLAPMAPRLAQYPVITRRVLAERVAHAIAAGASEVVLSDDDIAALAPPSPVKMPTAFVANFQLAASSFEAIDRGEFTLYYGGSMGPPGTTMLGRFCHFDSSLHGLVRDYAAAEATADPDAVYAEIVHLPAARSGNVTYRPVLRDYEIPIVHRSGIASDRQLPVADLEIAISGDHVELYSVRLGRRVIPRLSAAVEAPGVSLYQFLHAVQDQQGTGLNMGHLLELPHVPRIRHRRCVLLSQRWRVSRVQMEDLNRSTMVDRCQAMARVRQQLRLPRYVALEADDQTLTCDLDNPLSVDGLIHSARRQRDVVLTEVEPLLHSRAVAGPEAAHRHELLVPFIVPATSDSNPIAVPKAAASRTSNPVALPGSEWLYLRVYGSCSFADAVLTETIAPLTAEMREAGATDGWFYLRYRDPDHHLRIRFHGPPERLTGQLLPLLSARLQPLLASQQLWRVDLGTYERETSRYGGREGLAISEQMFCIDSQACIDVLALLDGSDPDASWRLALLGMDRLLGDFGLTGDDRLALVERAAAAYAAEYRADAVLSRAVGPRFRRERDGLEHLLDPVRQSSHDYAPALEVFERRSQQLAPLIDRLRTGCQSGAITTSLHTLVRDHIHMFVNRMLAHSPREQEAVLYELLARIERSRKARGQGS
jgi:lantibiotic biosynthesis protein